MRLSRRDRSIAISVAVHLLVFTPLLAAHRIHTVAVRTPGTLRGSIVTLTYAPGRAPLQAEVAAPKAAPAPAASRLISKAALPQKLAPGSSSPGVPNPDQTRGGDSLGSGNVTVALATYFPWPRPNLGQLPRGTRGDVVVDITIDEQGKIVQTQIAQSMGPAVDDNVLATIQTWVFKPATRDGVAVASEQELLFHYERG